jgi:hypothetical protein
MLMPYVKRNAEGKILALSMLASDEYPEFIEPNSDELKLTLAILSSSNTEAMASDLAMVRVIEDLIDILLAKSLISINDLPQSVQLKLLARKNFRKQGSFSIGNDDLIHL